MDSLGLDINVLAWHNVSKMETLCHAYFDEEAAERILDTEPTI